jgi:hypothetical protein
MKNKIIASTKWSGRSEMDNPYRFVVMERINDEGIVTEYTCHDEVDDGVHKENFSRGYYTATASDALNNMLFRIAQNNSSFHVGNVSHIPKGVEILVDIDNCPIGSKYVG